MYICPVCGYDELLLPPEDWEICPSCNTEFGYSDQNWGNDVLRRDWIQGGAKWANPEITPPLYWSPIDQLRNIDYEVSNEDKVAIAHETDEVVLVSLRFEIKNPVVIKLPAVPNTLDPSIFSLSSVY